MADNLINEGAKGRFVWKLFLAFVLFLAMIIFVYKSNFVDIIPV